MKLRLTAAMCALAITTLVACPTREVDPDVVPPPPAHAAPDTSPAPPAAVRPDTPAADAPGGLDAIPQPLPRPEPLPGPGTPPGSRRPG